MSIDVDPFEALLKSALDEDAERAPDVSREWSGPFVVGSRPLRAPHSRRIAVGAAWLATAAAGVGVLAVTTRPDTPAPAAPPPTSPAPAVPPPRQLDGEEFPLTDLGPAADLGPGPFSPVVAGLSRSIGIEGRPFLVFVTSLEYHFARVPEVSRCAWGSDGAGGCNPDWNEVGPAVEIVRTEAADFDVWTWDPLPPEAVIVTYRNGELNFWQRPVAGVAAFPAGEDAWNASVAVAYDANGVEVARWDAAVQAALQAEGNQIIRPLMADLSQAQSDELRVLTWDAMRTCLTERGGEFDGGDVATFPVGVDDVAIFNECASNVKTIVAERVDEINPRFFDPRTERPENPATPFGY